MTKLKIETVREGYALNQIRETMTAGELIEFLNQYEPDTPIYLSFDSGYTYGALLERRIEECDGSEEDDE